MSYWKISGNALNTVKLDTYRENGQNKARKAKKTRRNTKKMKLKVYLLEHLLYIKLATKLLKIPIRMQIIILTIFLMRTIKINSVKMRKWRNMMRRSLPIKLS